MRLALRYALAAAALLTLSLGAAAAGAMPGSGTGQLKYQEVVVDPADHTGCVPDAGCPAISDRGSLVVSFDEGGLKSLASVDYRLDASVTAVRTCVDTGETIGTKYSASNTVAGLVPDDKGTSSAASSSLERGSAACRQSARAFYSCRSPTRT